MGSTWMQRIMHTIAEGLHMHFKITAFALGVLSLYGLSDLPPLIYIVIPLAGVGFLALKFKGLWPLFVFIAGILWVVFHSFLVTEHWLDAELENQYLLVSGRVYDLPEERYSYAYGKKQHSYRFIFNVDCAQPIAKKHSKHLQQYFDQALDEKPWAGEAWADKHCHPDFKKVLLQWYDSEQKIKPGQRWQLVIRAKRPHGYANPGGFDYEKWLFQQGISAVGYVKNKAPNQMLPSSALVAVDLAFAQRFSAAFTLVQTRINYQRWLISEKISQQFENKEYAALVSALVVGDRRYINDQQREVLQRTGTAHLLAVSGLHIGLLAGVVYFLVSISLRAITPLQIFSSTRKIAMLAALSAAFIYSALAGFSTPTIRALVMLATFSWYLFRDRESSVWDGFFWSLFWVLVLNPLSVLSPGFWLSFIAVFSILSVISGRISKVGAQSQSGPEVLNSRADSESLKTPALLLRGMSVRWQSFLQAVSQTLVSWGWLQWAVFVGLTPLAILFFDQVSLIAPAINLLIIPVFAWSVVPLSLLGGLSLSVLPGLGAFLLSIVEWLLNIIWPLFEWASNQTLAIKSIALGEHIFLILPVMIAVVLLLAPRGMPFKWLALVFMLPLLSAFTWMSETAGFTSTPAYKKILGNSELKPGEFDFTVLDVGQGLSAVIQTAHYVLVYDTGYKSSRFNAGDAVIVPYLQHKGTKQLDLLLLSHDDDDHTGGVEALVESLQINKLAAPSKVIASLNRSVDLADTTEIDQSLCSTGKAWQWDGVNFYALSLASSSEAMPGSKLKDNDQSCILKIWNENISILLPGDLEKKGEKLLLDRLNINPVARVLEKETKASTAGLEINLNADILVAPHHGSKSSTSFAFLEAVSPKQVIFAVGYLNRFGHPHPLVQERYESIEAQTFSTALKGAIEYKIRQGTRNLAPMLYRHDHRHVWNTL